MSSADGSGLRSKILMRRPQGAPKARGSEKLAQVLRPSAQVCARATSSLKANDLPIRSATQLRNLIGLTPVGQHVQMVIERDRAQEGVTVEIAPLTEQKPKIRAPHQPIQAD